MRAIELFSGSGAFAFGFRSAGIEFAMAFDASPDACASYEANLGARPIQLDVRDLLRMLRDGWSPGRVDFISCDPPCAMWSRAGKREGLADPRDMLEETVEIIRLIRPLAYLVGNIPGLQDSTHWPVVQRTIGSLSKVGYCVRDFAVLDAVHYGVPQFRERPFWYGHLAGPCLSWPEKTHGDPKKLKQYGLRLEGVEPLKPWVTCQDALGHLPVEEMGRLVRVKEPEARVVNEKRTAKGMKVRARIPQSARLGDLDAPAATVTSRPARAGSGDSVVLALCPGHPISQPEEPSYAILASDGGGAKGGRVLALPGAEEPTEPVRDQPLMGERVGTPDAPAAAVTAKASRVGAGAAVVLDWPWNRPATAVTTDDRIAPPVHVDRTKDSGIFKQPNAIMLSLKAATILQGLPESWVFVGKTKKALWEQLGQALPPAVAAALGRAIRVCFQSMPDAVVPLPIRRRRVKAPDQRPLPLASEGATG